MVPDFIANPGDANAACAELISDVTNEENARTRATVTEAMEFTRAKVSTNVRQMLELADSVGVDPVRAGLYLSYQRVFGEA